MATKKIKPEVKGVSVTDKEKVVHTAQVTLRPSVNAAAVIAEYAKPFGDQDINALAEELRGKFDQVEKGDLALCESMLVGQANALQTIFVSLARRAANQEYLKQYEIYLKLALKAQNQSRMTLETLAKMKNPPVIFAKQANITQGGGNQQVNNGVPAPGSHAGKTINQQNELLEVNNGSETVDSRATSGAIGKNPAMATLD